MFPSLNEDQRRIFEIVKDFALAYLALKTSYQLGDSLYHRGINGLFSDLGQWIKAKLFAIVRKVPNIDSAFQKDIETIKSEMRDIYLASSEHLPPLTKLPETGLSASEIHQLTEYYNFLDDIDWSKGRVSGAVYFDDAKVKKITLQAFNKFYHSDPLYPRIFRGIRKMEAEIVGMVAEMYKEEGGEGVEQVCGTMTSGSSESALLVLKAYRDQARQQKSLLFPEVIAPSTIHPDYHNAAHILGIKMIILEANPLKQKIITKEELLCNITPNAIAIMCSAPCYPYGMIDNVEILSKVALDKNIGCHVDCSLGGLILPQLCKLASVRKVDFSLPGVTSISCDLHLGGFAPHGAGVNLYRHSELRRYQYFVQMEWVGGIHATPSLLGNRSGSCIAATWSTLMAFGSDGYRKAAGHIKVMLDRIVDGIRHIDGLYVIGDPVCNSVAFGSFIIDIYMLNEQMIELRWHLDTLRNPQALRFECTLMTSEDVVEGLLHDLSECVEIVKNGSSSSPKRGPNHLYEMIETIPDKNIIANIGKDYLDILYMQS